MNVNPVYHKGLFLKFLQLHQLLHGRLYTELFLICSENFHCFFYHIKYHHSRGLGLTKFLYIVSKALWERVVDFQDLQDFFLSDVWTYRLLNKMLLSLSAFLSAYCELHFLRLPQQESFFVTSDHSCRKKFRFLV